MTASGGAAAHRFTPGGPPVPMGPLSSCRFVAMGLLRPRRRWCPVAWWERPVRRSPGAVPATRRRGAGRLPRSLRSRSAAVSCRSRCGSACGPVLNGVAPQRRAAAATSGWIAPAGHWLALRDHHLHRPPPRVGSCSRGRRRSMGANRRSNDGRSGAVRAPRRSGRGGRGCRSSTGLSGWWPRDACPGRG